MDLACSILLGALLLLVTAAYGVRLAMSGRARHARVDAEGRSALVGKGVMEMLVWSEQPIVKACVRLGLSPDAVTFASIVPGVGAGVALAAGHFGVAALLAVLAAAADSIDGQLARHLGVSSEAGEVLDASVDRYVDFALIGGLAFHYRLDAPRLALALFALLASFMVSYSTAKADALHLKPPRGSMRRLERSLLVVTAAALTPATGLLGATWGDLPMLVALGMIAVAGNASAIQRLAAIRNAVRERRVREGRIDPRLDAPDAANLHP